MENGVFNVEEIKPDVFVIQGIRTDEKEKIKTEKLIFENEIKKEINFENDSIWPEEKLNCEKDCNCIASFSDVDGLCKGEIHETLLTFNDIGESSSEESRVSAGISNDEDSAMEIDHAEEVCQWHHEGTSNSITGGRFYTTRRATSQITRLIQPIDCVSDKDEFSDSDYIIDPDFQPPIESSDETQSEEEGRTNVFGVSKDPVLCTLESSAQKKMNRLYWSQVKKRENAVVYPQYVPADKLENEKLLLPLEYFRLFATDYLLERIVAQSNWYAIQKNVNKPLNISQNELEQWLGISMDMSISKIGNTRLHWSADSLNKTVASIMSRQRWEDIKANLHFIDKTTINQNDKLAKVRLLIDHLRNQFKKIPMTEHMCIDKQMVPFKRQASFKKYIPKKPHKGRYKLFILADSKGMVYDFLPCTDKMLPFNRQTIPDLGSNSNFVLQLAEAIPENKNYKLYIDHWFTSVPLIHYLASRGIWVCGAAQARRLHSLVFKSDSQLSALGRGSYDEHETKQGETTITAVKWCDNRSVCLASSFATSHPIENCNRYDKKIKSVIDVPIPFIVRTYNQHMGGVDLHDQLMAYYRMSFRSKKYYMRLFFHLIDMVVVNCWLLYRRSADKQNIKQRFQYSLCEFKLKLSKSLMMNGKDICKKRERPSGSSVLSDFEKKKKCGRATKPLPTVDIRKDGVGHYPSISDKRGMCRLPGCKGKVLMFCTKCEVHLCCEKGRNCFLDFHQN